MSNHALTDSDNRRGQRLEFRNGTAARDANDLLIYDPDTGHLFYDSDGNGEIAAELVAQLQVGLALTWTDFAVF